MSSGEIKAEIGQNIKLEISTWTIRIRQQESELHWFIAQKNLNVSKKNIKKRLQFAKKCLKKTHISGAEFSEATNPSLIYFNLIVKLM